MEIQSPIKINNFSYSSSKKNYNFSNYSLPILFLRNMYERRLSKNGSDEVQSMFYNEIKRAKHGRIPGEKKFKNFNAWKRVLNAFKNNIFPVEVIYDNACEKSSSASSKNTDKETNPRHRS